MLHLSLNSISERDDGDRNLMSSYDNAHKIDSVQLELRHFCPIIRSSTSKNLPETLPLSLGCNRKRPPAPFVSSRSIDAQNAMLRHHSQNLHEFACLGSIYRFLLSCAHKRTFKNQKKERKTNYWNKFPFYLSFFNYSLFL